MISSISRFLDVLEEFNISPNQFLLPYLLVLDQDKNLKMVKDEVKKKLLYGDTSTPVANIYRYNFIRTKGTGQAWTSDDVKALIDGGALQKPEKGGNVAPEDLRPTTRFRDAVFANMGDFDDFFFTYPLLIENPDGSSFPAKGNGYEETHALYKTVITNRLEHERLMKALEWGLKHGKVRVGIEKFLKSRMYRDLENLMEATKEGPKGTSTTSGNTATEIDF